MNLTQAANILKIKYEPPIRKWLNNYSYFLTKVKKNTKDFVGSQAYIPVHKGRNVGVGVRAEEAALPSPGHQQYDKLVYTTQNLYGTIRLSGKVIAAAKNSTGSFARAIDSEMQGLMNDVKDDHGRQIWRDGSGFLTVCGTTSNSSTVNVSSTKYIEPGMIIDMRAISDGTGVTSGTGVAVVTVPSSTTFTVATAVTTSSSHAVMKTGSRSSTAWGTAYEVWGLEALIDSSNPTTNGITDTIGGLTRTGNTKWQANVLSNSGTNRDLTLDLMQQAFDQCDIEAGKTPGLILTNHAIMRRYFGLTSPDRRFTGSGLITFDGGFKGLEFNGVPLMADKHAGLAQTPGTLNRIYFLDLGAFELHLLEDWKWMDRDGAILTRAVGTLTSGSYSYAGQVDAYEAALFSYQQLGIDQANCHCVLKDISES